MTTTGQTQDRATQPTTTWNIDPAHSAIEFAAKHMMITTVKGRLAEMRGALQVDEANPERSSVEVEFDTASVDTRAAQRDDHLRSADFLDVERFPIMAFRSTRIEGARMEPGTSFRVVGDLTIRDVTREVTLDAVFEGSGRDPWGGDRVSFAAETKIDRRDFGLTWNTTLETGGILVSNDIRIQLEVQAVRAA
ncbi:MAG: YceI family protein [Gemmatimonadaceae bacterium]